MRAALLVLLPGLLLGQSTPKPDSLFWSQTAFAAAGAADIAGSWGAQELNPLLGSGRFGRQQAVRSAAITAGMILAGNLVVKRWPKMRRVIVWSSYGAAGVRGYGAVRTWRAERYTWSPLLDPLR